MCEGYTFIIFGTIEKYNWKNDNMKTGRQNNISIKKKYK